MALREGSGVARRGGGLVNTRGEKAALRKRLRAESAQPAPEAGDAVQETVMTMSIFREALRVGCYSPVGREVPLDRVVRACRRDGKEISLPVSLPSGEYGFMTWEPGSALGGGRFGIPEPQGGAARAAAELDVVLVPGVAFDRFGGRLGRGTGFYDRLLAGRSAGRPLLVGVAFSRQMVDSVPMGANDVAMDCVVTERGISGGATPPWKTEA